MHSEYKKDHTYLLAFITTVLLSLNYLIFANKNKVLPFKNFDWLTKIKRILGGDVYRKTKRVFNISTLVLSL